MTPKLTALLYIMGNKFICTAFFLFFIRYDLESNEIMRAMPIFCQPEPEGRPQINIIEGYVYLIGTFKNSKYSVFRAELQNFHKANTESEDFKYEEIYSISQLFNDKKSSDIIIKAGGKDIYAHKEILVII